MSDLLNEASLVLIPSGIKASKVYAQIPEDGSGDMTFARASDATRVNSLGLVEVVGSNIPRLNYQNGGGGCPSLLLEKQSTNLALYSEQFDNAAWTKYESTITANATTSPDGTQNADLLLDNSSTDAHSAYQVITASAGTLTWSVYAKAQNNNFLIISAYTGSHNRTWFNLSTGAVGTNASGNTATIENMGNGWYRCIVSRAYVSGTLVHEVGISKTDGVFSYTGNGADGVYIYGAQLEASSYPTSYINTTSASATRVADECYKTGISSLIGQSEGFLFGEVKGIATTYPSKSVIMSVNDGTSLNRVELSFNATTGYLTPRIYKAGSTIFVSDYYIGDVTQKFKFAIGYGGGRAVFYVNGTSIHETTGLTFFSSGTLTKLGNDNYNGSELGYGFVSQYILGTTNLTNSQLAELTA
jgi:hypothetical protein